MTFNIFLLRTRPPFRPWREFNKDGKETRVRKIEKRKTITALLLGLALSATAIQARNLTAKDTEKALAGILISINYQMKSLRIQLKTARTQMQIDWVKKDYEYFRKQIKHRLNKVGDTFPRASRYKQRRIQRDFKRLSRKFRNFKKFLCLKSLSCQSVFCWFT